MVRFKTRWLLLAIDEKPLATTLPSPSTFQDQAAASTSASILSAAQKSSTDGTRAILTPQLVTRLLRASLLCNFGDVAAGAFGGVLTCKYYSTHTGTAIIRCSRDAARLVWASATLISSPAEMTQDVTACLGGNTASLRIRVIHCGGTIKKVQNKAIELDRKLIMRLRAKQSRIVAKKSDSERILPVVSTVEDVSPAAPVIPITPVDDLEDLGEALDSDAPVADVPADREALASQSEQKNTATTDSKVDPETQALLAQSRKQINSISM